MFIASKPAALFVVSYSYVNTFDYNKETIKDVHTVHVATKLCSLFLGEISLVIITGTITWLSIIIHVMGYAYWIGN